MLSSKLLRFRCLHVHKPSFFPHIWRSLPSQTVTVTLPCLERLFQARPESEILRKFSSFLPSISPASLKNIWMKWQIAGSAFLSKMAFLWISVQPSKCSLHRLKLSATEGLSQRRLSCLPLWGPGSALPEWRSFWLQQIGITPISNILFDESRCQQILPM